MLQIALIGCGRISCKHFDALDQLQERIALRALCDLRLERAEAAVRSRSCCQNAVVYRQLADLLADWGGKSQKRLDAAVLALPNGLHAQAGIECARAGLHVLAEKPLAVRLEDGKALLQACRQAGKGLFLIHQNRFNPPVQQLWRAVAGGHLGRIYSLYANVFWTRPQSYYDAEGDWHGSRELDGGAFYTQASHYVDLVQWLAGGPPARLSAHLRTLARQIETEDAGSAFLEWGAPGAPDNRIATINMNMLTYPRNYEGSLLILAEHGTVQIGGTALNRLEHWQVKDWPQEPEDLPASYETDSVYGFGHRPLYAALETKLAGKPAEKLAPGEEAALISGESILDNLAILDAIQRSAQAGSAVVEL